VGVRLLAAVSLGGAGHLNPMLPLLDAARRRGDDVLVVGPAAVSRLVADAGLPFVAGAAPDEAEVAPIRKRLPTATPACRSPPPTRRRSDGYAASGSAWWIPMVLPSVSR